MTFTFTKATKTQARLRMALIGPAGSGKTMTALKIATALGGRIAVIDTEHGSASKYADAFTFDTLALNTFSPDTYVAAIVAATAARYDILVIDSLSHAWSGKEGALEQVDRAAKKSQSGNTYVAWRDVTPMHNRMVEAILAAPLHVIVTMRAKTEYVQEKDERGKTSIRKVGLAPVQRDGLEYEFDVVADMDADNNMIITKTRCPALAGQMYAKAGAEVATILKDWLTDGASAPPSLPSAPPAGNDTIKDTHAPRSAAHDHDPDPSPASIPAQAVPFIEALRAAGAGHGINNPRDLQDLFVAYWPGWGWNALKNDAQRLAAWKYALHATAQPATATAA